MRAVLALYAALLRLYPATFRHEFAEEMAVAFADSLGAAAARGPRHIAACCWRELRDVPGALLRQHWDAHRRGRSGSMARLQAPDRSLTVFWMAATVAGYGLGLSVTWAVANGAELLVGPDISAAGARRITEDYLLSVLLVPLLSLSVGALQYRVLRRYLPRMGWWIPATVAGWLLSDRLLHVRPDILFWVTGLSSAVPQWLLLRRRLPAGSWWLIANTAVWVVQFPLLVLVMMTGHVQLRIGPGALWAFALLPACASAFVLGPLIAQGALLPDGGRHLAG